MIHFATALHCEAQPLIEYYRMKPSGGVGRARFFEGENARLAVTGVGALAAAIGVTALAQRHTESGALWFNVGICGHKTLELGEALIANRVSSENHPERFFPQPPVTSVWPGCALHSLAQPSAEYVDGLAFDLEAYGFFTAALCSTTLERVNSVKIVSDNAAHPAGERLDKETVSRWISAHVPDIARYAEALQSALPHSETSKTAQAFRTSVEATMRFSATERQQLLDRVRKLDALLDSDAFKSLNELLETHGDAKSLLKSLQDRIDAESLRKTVAGADV